MPWPDPGLLQRIAAAADLTRRPLRHGAVTLEASEDAGELRLLLEARSPEGERLEAEDLELELYRSGVALHLTLAWRHDDRLPMLWHGGHALWMDASGRRCAAPADAAPLEALARRVRALSD